MALAAYESKELSELRLLLTKKDEEIAVLTSKNAALEKLLKQESRIVDLERRMAATEQYSRRECIELAGIPESVPEEEIEQKVVDLLNHAGVGVTVDDFHAVHRLKNKKIVIAKFISRKKAVASLKNKKKLRELDEPSKVRFGVGKVFVNESLCPTYRRLFGICNSLFKKKYISKNFTFNGSLYIVSGDEKINIAHINDLNEAVGEEKVREVLDEFEARKFQ